MLSWAVATVLRDELRVERVVLVALPCAAMLSSAVVRFLWTKGFS